MSVENIGFYLSMMDEITTMITLYSHTVRAQLVNHYNSKQGPTSKFSHVDSKSLLIQ